MTLRAYKRQKCAKIGKNHKIAYYEAKWNFKVPKIHSWVVILVYHMIASFKDRYMTLRAFIGQKGANLGQKTQNRIL